MCPNQYKTLSNRYRIPVFSREKTAYIKLRQKGYTINAIAKAFGRSTSIIHRILRNAWWILHTKKLNDLRKIPRRVRELHAKYSIRTLMKYLPQWESWILGDEGDPP